MYDETLDVWPSIVGALAGATCLPDTSHSSLLSANILFRSFISFSRADYRQYLQA